jgi:putative SOS response-associated peptidase YedK
MCGRFALLAPPQVVTDFFDLVELEGFPPRYNIAPTQPILVVSSADLHDARSNLPDRKAQLARWAFMPGWVKEPKDYPMVINARSESAISKPSFRAAMRHRRVLIPASGYYEWHRTGNDPKEKPQAYFMRPKYGQVVAFGGLMETWAGADGSEVDTAAILTTKANDALSIVHDRMPVVIKPEDFSRWLDCRTQEPREIKHLMQPVQDDFFEAIPVSDAVNKVANMGPHLIDRVEPKEPLKQKPLSPAKAQMSLF